MVLATLHLIRVDEGHASRGLVLSDGLVDLLGLGKRSELSDQLADRHRLDRPSLDIVYLPSMGPERPIDRPKVACGPVRVGPKETTPATSTLTVRWEGRAYGPTSTYSAIADGSGMGRRDRVD